MDPAKPRLSFNLAEAGEATGLNRNAIYRAIATDELKTFKIGRRRMVSARALQEFIDRKEAEARRDVA